MFNGINFSIKFNINFNILRWHTMSFKSYIFNIWFIYNSFNNIINYISRREFGTVDILPALKREDSHGTVPLGWDIVVYDVTCS